SQRSRSAIETCKVQSRGRRLMPRSMTGFARQESQYAWGQLICEVRSVNHRYLEPTLRLSDSVKSLEPQLRDMLRKRLGRGKVEVVVAIKMEGSLGSAAEFNLDLAQTVVQMVEKVNALTSNPAPVNGMDVLQWPGVLHTRELDQQTLEQA